MISHEWAEREFEKDLRRTAEGEPFFSQRYMSEETYKKIKEKEQEKYFED
jgi:hypothetical protein